MKKKFLRLRFGLDDGRTRTLEEVGREFNVTRERIRQIEAKALRKLKHPSRSKRLKGFLRSLMKLSKRLELLAYLVEKHKKEISWQILEQIMLICHVI